MYFSVSSDPTGPISQTLSEGQLSATATGTENPPSDGTKLEDLEMDYNVKASLNDEGINRFVLDCSSSLHSKRFMLHFVDFTSILVIVLCKAVHWDKLKYHHYISFAFMHEVCWKISAKLIPSNATQANIMDHSLITSASTKFITINLMIECDYVSRFLVSLTLPYTFRSAVFICDKPGSIAASIPDTKSGSDIKATLLKKLSSGGCADCKNETAQEGASGACKASNRKTKMCVSHPRVKSLSSPKRSVSAVNVRSPPCSRLSLASSKSASSALSVKKAAAVQPTPVSKLAVSKRQSEKDKVRKYGMPLEVCSANSASRSK